jgi:chromosome segregation ATPase
MNAAPPTAHEPEEVGATSIGLDDLEAELRRLAAAHEELVGGFGHEELPAEADAPASEVDGPAEVDELTLLRAENAELRAKVEELDQLLQVAEPGDNHWAERQKEYETLLEEKSEVIRHLHMRLQDLQEALQNQQAGAPAAEAGVAGPETAPADPAVVADLDRQRQELEDQRRQLQEDEESLMTQMRQMELAMARDRADIARQRNELTRLQADLNREIEQAGRDPELQERLKNLRRPSDKKEPAAAAVPVTSDTPTKPIERSSGIFRRMFGK